jgi:hypothetical protein
MKTPSPDVLRPLRRRAAVAWAGGVLSLGLVWGEHRLGVLHLWALPFVALLLLTFAPGVGALARGLWRLLRGPRCGPSLTWALVAALPAAAWVTLGWYGFHQWGRREVTLHLPDILVRAAGASLMEGEAHYLYPHRLETGRLVMFYGEGLSDPRGDAEAMDRHLARLEALTARPLRTKVHWVRGPLLGQRYLSLYGLALGSARSPASQVDRHELAHAVLYQQYAPDTDPPTLLAEGWAEAQSQDGPPLATQALAARDQLARRLLGAVPRGYLRELTDPFWYHHDAGPVYPVGGAFVDFLLRRYRAERFVRLYFACRPGIFEAECRRVYGTDLDALEAEFWQDAARSQTPL